MPSWKITSRAGDEERVREGLTSRKVVGKLPCHGASSLVSILLDSQKFLGQFANTCFRRYLWISTHCVLHNYLWSSLYARYRTKAEELFSSPMIGFCQLSTKETTAWEAKSLWPCAAPVWSSVLRLEPNLPQTVLTHQRTVKLKGSGASGRSRLKALGAWHELLLLAGPAPDLSKKPIQHRKPTMLRKKPRGAILAGALGPTHAAH